jgi:hypothetical protein
MLRERERQKALEEASLVRNLPPMDPLPPFGSTATPLQGVPAVFSVYSHIDGNGEDVYKAYSPRDNYEIYKAIITRDHGEVQVTEPRTNKGLNEDGQPHIRKLFFGDKANEAYQEWAANEIYEHLARLYTENQLAERVMYNQLIQSSVSGDQDMAFVRIAMNRADPSPTTNTGMISCLKEKPTARSWPERRMQIKNQSLCFYNVGDTTLRGSSITDLTGASITSVQSQNFFGQQTENLIITIKPKPILNPPEEPEPLPFRVEANHSTETYRGQIKTVALDSEGETKISLPLREGTVILEKLREVATAEITYREPEPEPAAVPKSCSYDWECDRSREYCNTVSGMCATSGTGDMEPEPEPELGPEPTLVSAAMDEFSRLRLHPSFGVGGPHTHGIEHKGIKWAKGAKGAATPVVRGWTADDPNIPSEDCE